MKAFKIEEFTQSGWLQITGGLLTKRQGIKIVKLLLKNGMTARITNRSEL